MPTSNGACLRTVAGTDSYGDSVHNSGWLRPWNQNHRLVINYFQPRKKSAKSAIHLSTETHYGYTRSGARPINDPKALAPPDTAFRTRTSSRGRLLPALYYCHDPQKDYIGCRSVTSIFDMVIVLVAECTTFDNNRNLARSYGNDSDAGEQPPD